MGDLYVINEIYNVKNTYLVSTVTNSSKISVFVTVSFIIRFEFLFDVFFKHPWSLGSHQRETHHQGRRQRGSGVATTALLKSGVHPLEISSFHFLREKLSKMCTPCVYEIK